MRARKNYLPYPLILIHKFLIFSQNNNNGGGGGGGGGSGGGKKLNIATNISTTSKFACTFLGSGSGNNNNNNVSFKP